MPRNRKKEAGFTLIETLFACVILAICSIGILSLFTISAVKNSNRGNDATRTTEYAQDKMEQLMALQFQDTTSSTITHFDGTNYLHPCLDFAMKTTCTGTGLSLVGSLDPKNPYTGNVDYISQNPVDQTWVSSDSSAGASYVRLWQVTPTSYDSSGNLTVKTITVYVYSQTGLAAGSMKAMDGLLPSTTLVSQKTAVEDTF